MTAERRDLYDPPGEHLAAWLRIPINFILTAAYHNVQVRLAVGNRTDRAADGLLEV